MNAPLVEFQSRQVICRRCKTPYEALVGLSRYCDPCTASIIAQEKQEAAKKAWHESWPARAKQDSEHCSGPALTCARSIMPILAGSGVVILCGDRGTGKTVLATWLAGEMRRGIYTKAYDLFAEIKASWAKDSKATEMEVLKSWRKPRLLVIDEAQERGDSEWENRTLTNLVDHRYDDLKATLIITNQGAEATAKTLGASIIRRANQTGGVITCDWPSYV